MLRAFGVSDKGPVRPVNEDCFAIDESRHLLVVADGMGGHRAGEVAARIAVETICQVFDGERATDDWPFGFDPTTSPSGNLLRTAVHTANLQVLGAAYQAGAIPVRAAAIEQALALNGVAVEMNVHAFRAGRYFPSIRAAARARCDT